MLKKLESVGGQNPIDAAKMGCRIFHGPYVYNFQEIYALLSKYTKETLKHLNNLKHHACYNEMLDLITFSKIRKI